MPNDDPLVIDIYITTTQCLSFNSILFYNLHNYILSLISHCNHSPFKDIVQTYFRNILTIATYVLCVLLHLEKLDINVKIFLEAYTMQFGYYTIYIVVYKPRPNRKEP